MPDLAVGVARFLAGVVRVLLREALRNPVKENVDDGRGVEREHLAQQQAAHHRDAQRPAQFRAQAGAEGQRQSAEQRGHGRHHDGPESQQARFVDGVRGRFAVLAFRFEREVDDHDAVLLHDADQQNDADNRHHAQVLTEQHQRQQRAHTGGWQRRENRDRMDEAFVQNSQHDVDRDQRRQNQQRLVRERVVERCRRALKVGLQAGGRIQLVGQLVNLADRRAERRVRSQIERDGHRWKLALVRDGQRLRRSSRMCVKVFSGTALADLRTAAQVGS